MTIPDPNLGFVAAAEASKASGEVAKATAEVVKAVTANRDLANEAAKASPGHDVLGKIRNENLMMRSLIENTVLKGIVRKFFHDNEYVMSGEIYQDLASKLEGVPVDKVQPPKASIAGPVMEGIGYVLDEPALREMYLNLLASAVNSDKAPQVHPSFVEIIRQLSAQEVVVLDLVLRYGTLPAIRLQNKSLADSGYQLAQTCVLNLVDPPSGIPLAIPDLPMWVANWQRLGLVDLTFAEWFNNDPEGGDPYDWAKKSPEYNALAFKIHEAGLSETREAAYERGMIRATPLGARFFEIVMKPQPAPTAVTM